MNRLSLEIVPKPSLAFSSPKKESRMRLMASRLTPEQSDRLLARLLNRLKILTDLTCLDIDLSADRFNPLALFNPKYVGRNVRKQASRTLLGLAAEGQYFNTVQLCVEKLKADVNITDKDGNTPLMIAVNAGRTRTARFLLQKGARLIPNKKGISPLTLALIRDMPAMIGLFAENDVDLNRRIPELEETPVLCAALLNNPKSLRKLLELGATVHVTTKQGTPLTDIVSRRSDKILPEIRMLICQAVQKEPTLITSSIPRRQAISPDHTRV